MRTILLLLCLAPTSALAQPVVLWASDPIRPGETALVFGEGFESTKSIQVIRLDDGDPGLPPPPGEVVVRGEAITVEPLQPRLHSVKFTIPEDLKPGIFACRIYTEDGEALAILNRPTPIWLLGDQGPEATSGGWVKVYGRCLGWAKPDTRVLLRGNMGDYTAELFRVPCGWVVETDSGPLPPGSEYYGRYKLYVHNGYGGVAGWSAPLDLLVRDHERRPGNGFDVRRFGAVGDGRHDDTAAVKAALDTARENGGGQVLFRRGCYKLTEGIEIPPRTELLGQGRDLVAIVWPELPNPPEHLIFGKKSFSITRMTFYCTNYVHFLGNDLNDPDAGDVHLREVTVRADLYRGHLTPEQVSERFIASLKRSTGGGDTLRLRGSNITVEDCDLYGSGRVLYLTRGRGVLIRRNTLYNGRWGWYCISGADGVIFEGNDLIGADLMSTGGGLNCLDGSTCSQNVFYAYNRLKLMHGWDREAMTSDAGGGAYCGPLASATPTSVTLADEPKWDKRDWRGAGVFILNGKGMGQYRRIVRHEGRSVEVDEPWIIVPDTTSTVSVTMLQRNYYFIDNEFTDAGVAIQLYGMAIGNVMAGNRSTRTGGFHNFGMNYHGIQPSWFNQWLDNTIAEGNTYRGGHDNHLLAGEAHLGVFGLPPSADWKHPLTLCTIVRGNRLENNAHIAIGGTDPNNPAMRNPLVQEVIVEKNHVAKADIGIHVRRAAEGVLLRENTSDGVRDPMLTDDEIERRAAERRAKLLNLREPVACWCFDKVVGTKVPDDSGRNFAGRVVGSVRFEPGVKGNAAIFDGKSHIHVANGDLLQPTKFTIAAWIKPQTVAGRHGIIAKRTGHAPAPFVLSLWDGALEFEACEADNKTWSFNFRSPKVIKEGEWQHVAAVVEEGKGVTLYLDGKPIARKENPAKLAQNDLDLWIGKEAWGADPKDSAIPCYFTGAMDDLKLWSRALSEEEIRREAEKK
jgi:hypothetical protein